MLLTRDQILSANDLQTRDVQVPEWGGDVRLRQLSALQVTRWRDLPESDTKYVALLVSSIVDETGATIFTAEDVDALAQKNIRTVELLMRAAFELNKLGGDDDEKNA